MAETETAVGRSRLGRLRRYAARALRLRSYLDAPGDRRPQPQIAARVLIWSLLAGYILRECAYHAVEALVRSPARLGLGVERSFGDDALAYFTERLDAGCTRAALLDAIRQAKRNKAFDDTAYIGLIVDGTTAGRSAEKGCTLCRPHRDGQRRTIHYEHSFCLLSVVGAGLSLPCDVEPYGPGDSEYAAGRRLLKRAVEGLGTRFATHVVADGNFARAPFLHDARDLGLRAIVRLKNNLPELYGRAQQRFGAEPPHASFKEGTDRIEVWDADDFGPWETLRWKSVRVLRYRQHKANGTVHEAYWLTDFSRGRVGSRSLYRLAKSRWDIENHGFNDGKTRYGMEHICHHHPNSLLLQWLLISLALTTERLFRLRHLHRGTHALRSANQLLLSLWLELGSAPRTDTG